MVEQNYNTRALGKYATRDGKITFLREQEAEKDGALAPHISHKIRGPVEARPATRVSTKAPEKNED